MKERSLTLEGDKQSGYYTHSPNDIFKLFHEVFYAINLRKIPLLTTKVLQALHQILIQYFKALYQMICRDPNLSVEYLIALSNNYDMFIFE